MGGWGTNRSDLGVFWLGGMELEGWLFSEQGIVCFLYKSMQYLHLSLSFGWYLGLVKLVGGICLLVRGKLFQGFVTLWLLLHRLLDLALV